MQNLLLYIPCALIWGSTWIAIKFQLGTVDPLLSIAYRYGLGMFALLAFCALTRKFGILRLTIKQYLFVSMQAFFMFFLSYWLFYLTSRHLASGLVAVTLSTITIMNIFNQAIFFRIKVERQVILATLFGLTGIACVFWPELKSFNLHDETIKGIILGLVATYAASLGNIMSYYNSRNGIPVLASNLLGMGFGAIFALLTAITLGAPIIFDTHAPYVLSLLYLSIFGSAIAFGAYFKLMSRIGPDRAAYISVIIPIIALIISTFFENYHWSLQAFIGIIFVLIGNILALTKPEKIRSLILLKKNSA